MVATTEPEAITELPITMGDATHSGTIPVTMITIPLSSDDMEITTTTNQDTMTSTAQDTGIMGVVVVIATTIKLQIPVL